MSTLHQTTSESQVVYGFWNVTTGRFKCFLRQGDTWLKVINLSSVTDFFTVFPLPEGLDLPPLTEIAPGISTPTPEHKDLLRPLHPDIPHLLELCLDPPLSALDFSISDLPPDLHYDPTHRLVVLRYAIRPHSRLDRYTDWVTIHRPDHTSNPQASPQESQLQKPHLSVVPEPEKPPRKDKPRPRVPADLRAWITARKPTPAELVFYRTLWRENEDRPHASLVHYTGHEEGNGYYYLKGSKYLAEKSGLSERTIASAIRKFKVPTHKTLEDVRQGRQPRSVLDEYLWLIRIRHQGYKGEGYSCIELAKNLKHRHEWRNKLPRRRRPRGTKRSPKKGRH